MSAIAQRALEVSDLRQLIVNQIKQRSETSDADIRVSAEDGIVTLTGSVKTKQEKIAVENVASQVSGVRAIANDLYVEPLPDRSNTEIAIDVLKALRGHIFLSGEDIRVIVRDGCVTLEGCVHQELQRMLAEAQIKRLRGIFGISNKLQVKPDAPAGADLESNTSEKMLSNGSAWLDTGEAEAG